MAVQERGQWALRFIPCRAIRYQGTEGDFIEFALGELLVEVKLHIVDVDGIGRAADGIGDEGVLQNHLRG